MAFDPLLHFLLQNFIQLLSSQLLLHSFIHSPSAGHYSGDQFSLGFPDSVDPVDLSPALLSSLPPGPPAASALSSSPPYSSSSSYSHSSASSSYSGSLGSTPSPSWHGVEASAAFTAPLDPRSNSQHQLHHIDHHSQQQMHLLASAKSKQSIKRTSYQKQLRLKEQSM